MRIAVYGVVGVWLLMAGALFALGLLGVELHAWVSLVILIGTLLLSYVPKMVLKRLQREAAATTVEHPLEESYQKHAANLKMWRELGQYMVQETGYRPTHVGRDTVKDGPC
jgi:hypothetical protein